MIHRARVGLDQVNIHTDERIFPVQVACFRCHHTLMDPHHYIDGYPSIRLNGQALAVSVSSVRAEANAVVAKASSRGPDGLRLDVIVRYTFAFDSGRIDAAAEIRNAGPAEVKGLSFGLGAIPWQNYNFSPYNAATFPALNFRVYERPDHALAWYNPNPVETAKAPLPGSLRPGAIHRLSYSVFTAAALPDLGIVAMSERGWSDCLVLNPPPTSFRSLRT